MPQLLLNTIALDPNRWTVDKIPFFQLSYLIQCAAEAGFRFFELWQYHLTHASPDEIGSIHTLAVEKGLFFPVAGLYPRLSVTGPARDRELGSVDTVLDRAARLGVHVVKMFVGDRGRGSLRQREYEEAVITMSILAQHADAHGMKVAGEIHENTLFETIPSAIRFIDDVGAANFRVCFQPLDFADTPGTIADFTALGDRVIHIHFQGRKGDAMSLLREADIDYALFIHTLARAEYNGTMAIEFVRDCVVNNPGEFNLDNVLANALEDRDFLSELSKGAGLHLES